MFNESSPCFAITSDNVDYSGRNPRLLKKFAQQQRTHGGLFGRFENAGATSG